MLIEPPADRPVDIAATPGPGNTPRLLLASSSRYRAELLARLRIPFGSLAPAVDETPRAGEAPDALARRLAHAKALAGHDSMREVAPPGLDAQALRAVIGSDQVATLDGHHPIGKPGTHARAVAQLRAAAGRTVVFHTAVAVVDCRDASVRVDCIDTRVRFRELSDDDIAAYLAAEPAYDCAGSARVEALGITLLDALDGPDPTALIGLPLIALSRMLRTLGFALPG